MKPLFSILCALLLFSACSKTETTEKNEVTEKTVTTEKVNVSELNQKFITAWNTRQQDSLIAMFAEDVHFLQGDVHLNGKSQVADNWVRKTIGNINNLRLSTISSGADANMAYEAGTFDVDVQKQGPNGEDAEGEGNYILVWKKQESGKWKLSYAQLEDHPLEVK